MSLINRPDTIYGIDDYNYLHDFKFYEPNTNYLQGYLNDSVNKITFIHLWLDKTKQYKHYIIIERYSHWRDIII